jgi:hypothetical protein
MDPLSVLAQAFVRKLAADQNNFISSPANSFGTEGSTVVIIGTFFGKGSMMVFKFLKRPAMLTVQFFLAGEEPFECVCVFDRPWSRKKSIVLWHIVFITLEQFAAVWIISFC